MTRNTSFRGTALLHDLERQVRAVLPPDWTVAAAHERPPARGVRADLMLEIRSPDGRRGEVLVEAKAGLDPRDVPLVLAQLAHYREMRTGTDAETAFLVAAAYVSPRAREVLADAGAGWFDNTGNMRLKLNQPALFIDRVGASRRPPGQEGERRLHSVKGPAAARVVRALLDGSGPYGVRALAAAAEVGVATSARVLDLLAREDIVERDRKGTVLAVRKQSLVRRWTEDYGFMTSNNVMAAVAPRGHNDVMRRAAIYEQRYAFTGSAAVRAYLPADQSAVAPVSLLTLYVSDAILAQQDLGVRAVERGANVLLVEPFDTVVYRNSAIHDGFAFVHPSQAVADLLTGPGRSPQEAEQLLGLLATEDEKWNI